MDSRGSAESGPTGGPGTGVDGSSVDIEARAGELVAEFRALLAEGKPVEAVPLQQEVRRLTSELLARAPGDPRTMRNLGSLLYGLGSTLGSAGQPEEAVEALAQCADLYHELEELGEPGMGPLIADVHARTAQVLDAVGRSVSAVLEVDQAVIAYLRLGADEPDHPRFLDLARVLTLNSLVLYGYGDGDLAVRSAQWAVDAYLSRADEIAGAGVEDARMHGRHLREAADIAARVYTAQGRAEAALAAGETEVRAATELARTDAPHDVTALAVALTRHGLNLRRAGRGEEGDPLVERARGLDAEAAREAESRWERLTGKNTAGLHIPPPWSFSAALTVAARKLGDDQVPESLWELVDVPAEEAVAVTPSLRVAEELAPAVATTLAGLALGLLDEDRGLYNTREAGVLGREAHYLFAAFSRGGFSEEEFAAIGVTWARMLLALIRVSETGPESRAMAEDLTEWLGVVTEVLKSADPADPETDRLVLEYEACVSRLLA